MDKNNNNDGVLVVDLGAEDDSFEPHEATYNIGKNQVAPHRPIPIHPTLP